MNIKITTDSTCDLPRSVIEKYDISIVPLYINIGSETLKDGIEIRPSDIFDYVDSGMGVCSTAAASVGDYVDLFSKYTNTYDALIHINISCEFSACYQNACIAAEEFKNVYVVDSKNLSTGTGHLVMDAALLAQGGMDVASIVEELHRRAEKVESSFVIDSLKYLAKGGRCSSVAYLGANLLMLKPAIEVVDGTMEVGKKYRGAFTKCIKQYVTDRLKGRDDIDDRRIYCTYTERCPQEAVDIALETAAKYVDFKEVYTSTAGCTISNHCGTVCLGILFFRK